VKQGKKGETWKKRSMDSSNDGGTDFKRVTGEGKKKRVSHGGRIPNKLGEEEQSVMLKAQQSLGTVLEWRILERHKGSIHEETNKSWGGKNQVGKETQALGTEGKKGGKKGRGF